MAASGKFDLDPAQFGRYRNNWIWDATATMFEVMAEVGIPVRSQIEILWAMGIAVGRGGNGTDKNILECPVCGANGGGGHGGFCPNTSTDPEKWVIPR